MYRYMRGRPPRRAKAKPKKEPKKRKKKVQEEAPSVIKVKKRPTCSIHVTIPPPLAEEMHAVCEKNFISASCLIIQSMRSVFSHLRKRTQEMLDEAEKDCPMPENVLPPAPPIPDVTAKAVTAVRLPLEMWKEELLDDTPMAAEEESDPYEAPTDTP